MLVDSFITWEQASAQAEWIASTRKNLTTRVRQWSEACRRLHSETARGRTNAGSVQPDGLNIEGMRLRPFLLAVVLSQTACINVEDFGAYWDKAGTDRALAGTWRQVSASPDQTRAKGYGIGDTIHLSVTADAYEMVVHDAEGQRPDALFHPVKTLDVGRYHFLLERRTGGIMQRYSISGRTLLFCQQFGPGMVEFLRARYPDARSIHKNKHEGEYLVIDTFDDEAFTILSNIPDQEKYWDCDQKWERVN